MTSLPKVTILTANAGGGHRSAAQSLAEALEGQARVSRLNLLDEHAPFPFNTWSSAYGPCVTYAPWFYRLLYRYASERGRVLMAERALYPFVRATAASALLAEQADLVISVHGLQVDVPIWMLRRGGRRTPFVTVVTDPVTASVAWFSPEADLCVVASEPARQIALACGLAPSRVQVIGLPIRRAFLAARGLPKPEARARVGLHPARPLVLLTGGGVGVGRLVSGARAVAQRLAHHASGAQLAIVAGRNQPLQRRLLAEPWPMPVHVLGFVENMADWLAAADLLVTKAGPGTLAEAACLGVPVLITDFIPGQEQGNVDWVTDNGAGLFERDPERGADLVAELMRPGNPRLEQMAPRARAMAQPNAAVEIAQAALRLLDSVSSA